MPQLFEKISVDMISDKHDEDCYFCNAKNNKPEVRDCIVDDDFDEDKLIGLITSKQGIKHANCSGKLGEALGSPPGELWVSKEDWNYEFLVEFAAHHLIPGVASLERSKLYTSKKYLKVKGQKSGNIGYDVNAKVNGVWLPGNYAFSTRSKWGKKGSTFQKSYKVSSEHYASVVIEQSGTHFHDSHMKYNNFVKKKLTALYNKLKLGKKIELCPELSKASKKKAEKERPLYILVHRLANLSIRMKKMLVLPTTNWRSNIYTSSFAREWMNLRKRHLIKRARKRK